MTMPGKMWTAEEEAQLKVLVQENVNVAEIAVRLKKTPKAVITKSQRLGLQLELKGYVDTALHLPSELPSIEDALKIMAGAMRASVKPGLNKLEVQRLQTVANISKTYKELVVDYAHYRDVEERLLEMVEENAQLKKMLKEKQETSSSLPPQPVPSQVS